MSKPKPVGAKQGISPSPVRGPPHKSMTSFKQYSSACTQLQLQEKRRAFSLRDRLSLRCLVKGERKGMEMISNLFFYLQLRRELSRRQRMKIPPLLARLINSTRIAIFSGGESRFFFFCFVRVCKRLHYSKPNASQNTQSLRSSDLPLHLTGHTCGKVRFQTMDA